MSLASKPCPILRIGNSPTISGVNVRVIGLPGSTTGEPAIHGLDTDSVHVLGLFGRDFEFEGDADAYYYLARLEISRKNIFNC